MAGGVQRTLRMLVGASALFATAAACRHTAMDLAMTSAYRPADVDRADFSDSARGAADDVTARFQILAGDFH